MAIAGIARYCQNIGKNRSLDNEIREIRSVTYDLDVDASVTGGWYQRTKSAFLGWGIG